MTRTLALFFGTESMTFSVTNDATQAKQKTRTYARFADASDEVVEARIYEGIHFRFADEAAQRQGRSVAQWVIDRFLRPARR